MSAATTAQDNARKEGDIQAHPLIAAEIVYGGRPVLLNNSSKNAFTNDGTTNTLANDDVFAGIAAETVDNSAGAAAAKSVRTYQSGTFLMTFAATMSRADVGKDVYVNNATDDAIVAKAAVTDDPQVIIGKIVGIHSATQAWVRIDQAIGNVASTTAS